MNKVKESFYQELDVFYDSDITGKQEVIRSVYLINAGSNLIFTHDSESQHIMSTHYMIPLQNIIEIKKCDNSKIDHCIPVSTNHGDKKLAVCHSREKVLRAEQSEEYLKSIINTAVNMMAVDMKKMYNNI